MCVCVCIYKGVCRESSSLSLSLLSHVIRSFDVSRFILDDTRFLSNMMMISSPPSQSSTQSDSAKRLRLTIPRTSKNDPLNHSNTMSPTKLDDKSSQKQKKSIDCTDTLTAMKQQLSNAIENENDTTLLTTTTTTTTVEVKVKTTKTSSSSSSSRKRKLNVADEPPINTNADKNDNVSKQEQEQDQQPAVSKKKVIYLFSTKDYN